MQFAIEMGPGAIVLVLLAAVLFGLVAQLVDNGQTMFGWMVDSFAFAIGAIVASEMITALRTVEPVWDGLAMLPAVFGGFVVGVVVELAYRLISGGAHRSLHGPTSA